MHDSGVGAGGTNDGERDGDETGAELLGRLVGRIFGVDVSAVVLGVLTTSGELEVSTNGLAVQASKQPIANTPAMVAAIKPRRSGWG